MNMNTIIQTLRERLAEETAAAESASRIDPNCYGAGYGQGYVDALNEAIRELTNTGDTTHFMEPGEMSQGFGRRLRDPWG